ncbi:MAG: Fpg/Nei family DNA glycosylase [Planctomycetota bacterium]|jgi:endonuclease-8
MAEGPQVLRRTEWLHRYLQGRRVYHCDSFRPSLDAELLTGRGVVRVICKGKQIFMEFEGGVFLHNHQLMRGRWIKLDGRQMFYPDETWLGLYVGPYTICNLKGQRLKIINGDEMEEWLSRLGPDLMKSPCPKQEILQALSVSRLAISEALLDQSVVSGIGNIAKSEALYRAKTDPRLPACELDADQIVRLIDASKEVLWDSYRAGGRWDCRVYRRRGSRCDDCGHRIQSLCLKPSNRKTYYCPVCQRADLI